MIKHFSNILGLTKSSERDTPSIDGAPCLYLRIHLPGRNQTLYQESGVHLSIQKRTVTIDTVCWNLNKKLCPNRRKEMMQHLEVTTDIHSQQHPRSQDEIRLTCESFHLHHLNIPTMSTQKIQLLLITHP